MSTSDVELVVIILARTTEILPTLDTEHGGRARCLTAATDVTVDRQPFRPQDLDQGEVFRQVVDPVVRESEAFAAERTRRSPHRLDTRATERVTTRQ